MIRSTSHVSSFASISPRLAHFCGVGPLYGVNPFDLYRLYASVSASPNKLRVRIFVSSYLKRRMQLRSNERKYVRNRGK